MAINVKKIIDMADMFKMFESKLNMGKNVPQTNQNANRLSGLINVDEVEPLVPLPKGGVDVTLMEEILRLFGLEIYKKPLMLLNTLNKSVM